MIYFIAVFINSLNIHLLSDLEIIYKNLNHYEILEDGCDLRCHKIVSKFGSLYVISQYKVN